MIEDAKQADDVLPLPDVAAWAGTGLPSDGKRGVGSWAEPGAASSAVATPRTMRRRPRCMPVEPYCRGDQKSMTAGSSAVVFRGISGTAPSP